jgi:hypothetical protein
MLPVPVSFKPATTPTELPVTTWQTVGMDLTVPFPGREYILVVIDIMKLITS